MSTERAVKPGPGHATMLAGGGEMGKLIRAKDWSQTPLGPIDSWPQSLLTTVSLCISSNFPISIAWGPERTQIYNDGYWPICGAKHPRSLGQDFRECWFSAWPAIGEAFERASAGEAAFLVNERMFLDRYGYLEETFFTFSFSPIRDESGGVAGLFHPVTELTQQSLAERRLQVLRDLTDQTADSKSVSEACTAVARSLARHELDVPFAVLYRLENDGNRALLAGCAGLTAGTVACPQVMELHGAHDPVWPFGEPQVQELADLAERLEGFQCGPYPESPDTAFVLPINVLGLEHPLAVLVAGVSARRALDEPYRTFYLLLRDGVVNALTSARAYEEERRRAEALAELDRAKTAFFSNVSHEFRTPLTLLLGPTQEALADPRLLPETREQVEVIQRNALRLLKLVNTLLDFSRIEAGRVEAVFEPVDLGAFTAELASNFRSAIERAGLQLVVDTPTLAEPVYIDRDMWEKIVLNLLSNAFKHTFTGEIAVGVHAENGAALVTVRDTGVGIPADQLPHLFERFFRVPNARSRTYEGSGIGLALVHDLVELHGGDIHVTSREDKGTTFTVRIPFGTAHLPADRIGAKRTRPGTALAATAYVQEALSWLPEGTAAAEMANGAAAPVVPQVDGQKARVLLADDNADMRHYVTRLLREHGWTVQAVANGDHALAAALAEPPDLVLADIMMPGLEGFALLRALRDHPATSTLPVILLSARAGEEAKVEGLAAGADDYLVKPFTAHELVARVGAHLSLARVRQDVESSLRESEERYRRIFNTVDVSIWEEDFSELKHAVDALEHEGVTDIRAYLAQHPEFVQSAVRLIRIVDVNDATLPMFGARDKTALLDTLEPILLPESLAVIAEVIVAVFEGRPRLRSETRLRTLEGKEIQVAFSITWPAHDPEMRSVLVSLLDITARAQAEQAIHEARQEAETANQSKSEFLAAMSHELRTPLNAITGYVELLEQGIHGPVTLAQQQALSRIRKNGHHLLSLINDVLNFAKLEAGRLEYDITDVRVGDVISEVSAMLEAALAKKKLAYEVHVDPDLFVSADAEKLRQIMLNILSNAIKFTYAGGRITVDTGTREDLPADLVYLRVTDTGIGIPPDRLESIFDPFVQVHRSLTSTVEGTGLGLAISRDLARGMAGDLRARSVLGQGSTFTLTLERVRSPVGP